MRSPDWLLSGSTLSECVLAETMTWLPLAGVRTTEPNWFTTLMLAFSPLTVYLNSLRLPAASAYVLKMATHTARRFAFLRFMMPLPASARLIATVRGRAHKAAANDHC